MSLPQHFTDSPAGRFASRRRRRGDDLVPPMAPHVGLVPGFGTGRRLSGAGGLERRLSILPLNIDIDRKRQILNQY